MDCNEDVDLWAAGRPESRLLTLTRCCRELREESRLDGSPASSDSEGRNVGAMTSGSAIVTTAQEANVSRGTSQLWNDALLTGSTG